MQIKQKTVHNILIVLKLQTGKMVSQTFRNTSEVITPHKLAVVILILEYYKKDETVWLPKYLKKFGLLLLRLIQNADLSYRDLNNLIKSDAFCLHPSHIAQFENYMERLVSADKEMLYELNQHLDKFIDSVEANAKPATVNESSIVFLYLRRFMITLLKMSLLEEVSLHQALCEYYGKGIRAITLSSDDTTAMVDFTEANQQAMEEGRDFRRWNRKQVELFVGQQFNKLGYNESEALPPKVLQATIDEIIEDNPRYSPAYYLDYLNSLRCCDVFNCIEKIHRCFDVNEQRQISAKPGKGYQYYALNLAMLHARFGHNQLALSCLRESVMLAQEVGDKECIELAENWRQFLGNTRGTAIRGGSVETQSPFVSMNNQLVAKGCAVEGTGAKNALQIVSEMGFLNYNNSLLVASSSALKSAILNQMGKHHLAVLNSQLLLNCPLKAYGNIVNGEPFCRSILNVATWMSLQGDYDQAAVLFNSASETHKSTSLRKCIAPSELQASFHQYLAHRQWEHAAGECQKIGTYDEVEKGINLARLNVERTNYPVASAIIDQLLLQTELTPLSRTQLNVLDLEIMLSIPEKNYECLNLSIRTLNYAKEHNLFYEVALIQVIIARIQLALDMPTMAKGHVEKALIKILADGTLKDQADALWVYLRCLLCVIPKDQPSRVTELLTRDSHLLLDIIVQIYTSLDCSSKLKRCYQFLAELCHDFGLLEQRNRFAFKFKQLYLENV